MKPLHRRPESDRETWVLDLETDGFGPAVKIHEKAKPPQQILCILYNGTDRLDFWGDCAIDDAFDYLLSLKRDIDVYAHFGGAFDFRFAYPKLFASGAKWKLVSVGSIVLTAVGVWSGFSLRLVDSIRLFPSSLKKIGEALGIPKLDIDVGNLSSLLVSDTGRKQIAQYCFRDCEILYAAIQKAKAKFASLDVPMRATLASTSSSYVRSKLDDDTVAYSPGPVENDAEQSNFGGRVEVFRRYAEKASIYDIQSSYPYAMLSPHPWRYRRSVIGRSADSAGIPGFGVSLATVHVPTDCEIPVLPFRVQRGGESGRIYFPTGQWTGWFHSNELRYAEKWGYARIVRLHESHFFDESTILADFAREFWEQRLAAKKQDPNGFDAYFWKIFLNSCYGKLSEKIDKELLLVNPERLYPGLIPKAPSARIWAKSVRYAPGFRSVVTGGSITATARINLHRFLTRAIRGNGKVYYCDTDSITVSGYSFVTGKELGNLSKEHDITNARFLGAKLYSFSDTCHGGKFVSKGKGFPKLDEKQWTAMENGEPIPFERREGFGEALRRDSIVYRNLAVSRQHRNPRPKRCPVGSYSRAWDVREISG